MIFTIRLFLLFIGACCSRGLLQHSKIQAYPQVVIVGGGPSGLVSAITLQELGWKNIVVLEKLPKENIDSSRSYTYLIDGRGQRILNALNLTRLLPQYGVSFTNTTEFTEITSKGQVKKKNIQVIGIPKVDRYFIPRSVFIDLLRNEIDQKNLIISPAEDSAPGKIQLIYDCSVQDIKVQDDGKVMLQCKKEGKRGNDMDYSYPHKEFTLMADVLLGCDGINSVCRQFLQSYAKETNPDFPVDTSSSSIFSSFLPKKKQKQLGKKSFEVKDFDSPSANLHYKFIALKNSSLDTLRIKDLSKARGGEEEEVKSYPFTPEKMYIIRGKQGRLSMSFFPVSSKIQQTRAAGIIRLPSDPLWSLSAGDALNYLKIQFPQIVWDEFANENEIRRAFTIPPGRFPKPQFSSGMQLPISMKSNGDPGSYVALLGDAAHSFPPDLGQGVNAALLDVFQLRDSIRTNPSNLTKALIQYERKQQKESEAVAKLCSFAYPYQYNQSRLGKILFIIQFFGIFILSKFLPYIITEPAFYEILKYHDFSYSKILQRHKRTHRNIGLLFLSVVLALTYNFYGHEAKMWVNKIPRFFSWFRARF